MTLSDLQGHAPAANLFKGDFSHICAAVDVILADLERRAVPVRQLSFL